MPIIKFLAWPPVAIPNLIAICGRNNKKVEEAAVRYKYRGYYTDWTQMVKDPSIEKSSVNGKKMKIDVEAGVI